MATNNLQVMNRRSKHRVSFNKKTSKKYRFEESGSIRNVWKTNLEDEFMTIRKAIQNYKFVAIDTEFPGLVAKLNKSEITSSTDVNRYLILKRNVNMLNLIQLGITFFDNKGKVLKGPLTTWQFNFKIDLRKDAHAKESIELLKKSGIDFDKHRDLGIDPVDFAELLMVSGIILMEDVTFVAFHSNYDFAYLLRMLLNHDLPDDEKEFVELLKIYFPRICDIKYVLEVTSGTNGGLQSIATCFSIDRVGTEHQAGSDALLTGHVFFKMVEIYFGNDISKIDYFGHLYGLSVSYNDIKC